MALAPQGKQPMSRGKGKAVKGGAGGWQSTKAAAGSSGQGSSGQGSSRTSAPLARIIGFHTEEDAVQAAPPLAAEAAGSAQQAEPAPAGGGKKEKERQRKERQRQRKVEEAWEALRRAVELMEETTGARGVDAVEEAMQAAAKHEARSERLAALVAVARGLVEQARAVEAERAKVAAEEAAAAAVVEAAAKAEAAAERQQLEEQAAALTLQLQQVQTQLGVPPLAPAPDAEETQCVVCMDAPKNRVVLPCMHMCVCEACAQLLRCPLCRGPIERISQLFT
jgi:hypothetical protein